MSSLLFQVGCVEENKRATVGPREIDCLRGRRSAAMVGKKKGRKVV